MKIKEYRKFIKGYLYSLNECAKGNVVNLKMIKFGPNNNDNFNNGIFKGIFDNNKKNLK